MIVTVGGIKGGAGKSTLTTNFACIAAMRGWETLLVDADAQETSSDFAAARREDHPSAPAFTTIRLAGMAVRTELQSLSKRYEYVIIDTGGRDTASQRAAISISDRLLIPFAPRSFDVWTIRKAASLVEEMRSVNPNLVALIVINKADPPGQGTENDDAAELLAEIPGFCMISERIGNRKAYAHAASQGLSVTELVGHHRNAIASEEILSVFCRCFGGYDK